MHTPSMLPQGLCMAHPTSMVALPLDTHIVYSPSLSSLLRCPLLKLFSPSLLFLALFLSMYHSLMGFPGGSVVKNPPANAGDAGLILVRGRYPGE